VPAAYSLDLRERVVGTLGGVTAGGFFAGVRSVLVMMSMAYARVM
jgi:hypothetical protein